MQNYDTIGRSEIKVEVKYYLVTLFKGIEKFHSSYATFEEARAKQQDQIKLFTEWENLSKIKRVITTREEVEVK